MYQAMRVVALLVACIMSSAQSLPAKANSEVASAVYAGRKSVSFSKMTCPTAAQARLKAENKYPGWKVVNIKSLSKSWLVTMKK